MADFEGFSSTGSGDFEDFSNVDFSTTAPPSEGFGSFGTENSGFGEVPDFTTETPQVQPEAYSLPVDSFGSGSFDEQPKPTGSFGFDEQPTTTSGSFGFGSPAEAPLSLGSPVNSSSPYNSGTKQPTLGSPYASGDAPATLSGSFTGSSPQSPISPSGSFQETPSSPTSTGSFGGGAFRGLEVKSDVIREFEAEHEKFLEEKVAEEKKRHQEIKQKAAEELKQFYEERAQRTNKVREENRSKAEAASDFVPKDDKAAWANLASLVDWSDSHKEARSDVSRMRSVLLDMKHAA